MERTEWSIGQVALKFEPPDLFHCYVNGPVLVPDVEEMLKIMQEEVVPEVRNFYFLVHTGALGTEAMPIETRKFFANVKPLWKATVMIGGAPIARLAANVFMHAVMAISGSKTPMKVVKDEAEAISYVKELRSKLARSA